MTEERKRQIIDRTVEAIIADAEHTKMHSYRDVAMKAIEEIMDRNEMNSSTTKPAIN